MSYVGITAILGAETGSGGSDAVLITTIIVGAVGTIVANVLTFLTLWIKAKYNLDETKKTVNTAAEKTANKLEKKVEEKVEKVEEKLDANTKITKAGTEAAASNAKIAANTANEISQSLEKKLNGGVDSAISKAVDPLKRILDEHTEKIEELNRYVHTRNHDFLNAVNTQSIKIDAILEMMKRQHEQEPRTS